MIENIWVKKISVFSFIPKKQYICFLGNRYVELYFDAPRPSSSNSRRSKSNDHSRYSSLESTNNNNKTNENNSRSRSMHIFLFLNKINRNLIELF